MMQDEQKTRSQCQARVEHLGAILKCRRAENKLDDLQSKAREAELKEAEAEG